MSDLVRLEYQLNVQQQVFMDVKQERDDQDAIFGDQDPPDGTGPSFIADADAARMRCNDNFARGEGTFVDIALEEVYEAFAETDADKLYAEVIQCAAVFVKWAERIKIRGAKSE